MELRDKNGLTEAEFLASYEQGDYPCPSLAADVLIFNRRCSTKFGFTDCAPHMMTELLLVKRGGHPCLGMYALPGGFLNPDETIEAAALRELKEETNLEAKQDIDIQLVGVYSDPGRDPRAWIISSAFASVLDDDIEIAAGDDAAEAKFFKLEYAIAYDVCYITLTNGEDKLTGKVKYNKGGMPSEVLSSHGLAFDHAKIIADAIRKVL